jgi:hypothetical protein
MLPFLRRSGRYVYPDWQPNGKVNGTFGFTVNSGNPAGNMVNLTGTANGNAITGTWTMTGTGCSGTGTFTMTKM